MFPYTDPTSHHEVNDFMARHGAGTRTTIPRDRLTWAHSPSDMHENKPARVRYYIRGHLGFGAFYTYELPAAALGFQPESSSPSWYRAVLNDAQQYLAGEGFAFPGHTDIAFAPARIIDTLGNLLVAHGYPRVQTAFTIALYRYNIGNLRSYTAGCAFQKQFLNLAHLAGDDRLTMHQKLDVLTRQLSRADLDGMLDNGAPYTLIKEMFPPSYDAE